jgi:hypothetical protein
VKNIALRSITTKNCEELDLREEYQILVGQNEGKGPLGDEDGGLISKFFLEKHLWLWTLFS